MKHFYEMPNRDSPLRKIFPYFLLLMVPGMVGSGCFGGSSSSSAPNPVPTSQGPTTPTLSASASSLALAVNDPALSASLTGSPRTFTVTNTGGAAATSVAFSLSPALPTGTTISPANCGELAPAASCTITVTPGATPSPTPVFLAVAGTNTNTLSLSIEVLSYGSVHQAGYIFAIDDTTPSTGNIGGKVAALTDQAPDYPNGIIWSSNGNSASSGDAVFDNILGINESSTTPSSACNGSLDGACDSQVIASFYSPPNSAINRSYYATGLCSANIGGFTDWYLPAICEMGYDVYGTGSGCGTAAVPTMQNMQTSLVDNGGNVAGFADYYWSSTEHSGSPDTVSFAQYMNPGNPQNFSNSKDFRFGVRCVRAITN